MSPAAAPTIEVRELTKRYGGVRAVDHVSFDVRPGHVTGFLGRNGAGKSTTMRLVLGLDRPDTGTATIGGRPYRDLPRPLLAVGALLEARAVHPGRSGRNHLLALARTQGLGAARVDAVLELVGLTGAARRRAGGLSLGMGQRLGLAAALLGDPGVLVLDEPVNGLDPEGVAWIRGLLRGLAAEGRTVLISSHLMNEMAVTADHLVVLARGRLVADTSTADFLARHAPHATVVRGPDLPRLAALLAPEGGRVAPADGGSGAGTGGGSGAGGGVVTGVEAARIAEIAAAHRLVLHELTPRRASLEEAFLRLTADPEAPGPDPAASGAHAAPGAHPTAPAVDPTAADPDAAVPTPTGSLR